MSEQNQMTYQDAYDLLVTQIYAPVFFDKLANDFGIRPSSENEMREFLALSGKLQQLYEAEQVKQASDRVSLVSAASQGLDGVLQRVGVPVQTAAQASNEQEVKQAAAQLAQVPHVRNAALLYQDAMRQLMAQE